MSLVVGTAGHIDHGKTTLLRALTGIDADRLPEERRRGMTIDVGYAHMRLPNGEELDFVDVPGHDRLVGNMLVGAGEVDAVLLVVAADDGPRAQTLEHLELVDALGLTDGVVAITKADLIPDTRLREVEAAVADLLGRTRLAGAPVIAVSAQNGRGLDGLVEKLAALAGRLSAGATADIERPPRLAIDRAFSVRGRGVVVTGTLRGGSIRRGDVLRLVPDDGRIVVREVQVHGQAVSEVTRGRTALNLRGVAAEAIRRGAVLTGDPEVAASRRLLVALRPAAPLRVASAALPADRARLRLHIGTDQLDVGLGRAGRESVALPDGRASAILRLERPIAVAPGDRFVLRRSAASRTEAGGEVLDTDPPRGISRRRATPERIAALALAATSEAREHARLELHGAVRDGATAVLAADIRERIGTVAIVVVGEHHHAHPAEAGVALAELRDALAHELGRLVTIDRDPSRQAAQAVVDALVADGRLVRAGDRVRDPAHETSGPDPRVVAAMAGLESMLDTPAPPPLAAAARAAGCPPDGIRALERENRIVRVGPDLAWGAAAYRELERAALELASRTPLTPAQLRDATGTSRKYVMAILEDLDRRGILRRTDAGHVPGPRAPLAAER